MKTIFTVFALAAFIGAAPVIAETHKPVLAVFTGTCSSRLPGVSTKTVPCDSKVSFIVIGNGRSFVRFSSGDMSLAFTGGRDRQPNLNNYYLSVDTVQMIEGRKTVAVDKRMEGECHMTLSDDGSEYGLVHCDAYNRRRGTGFFFHLDNIVKTVIRGQ
jgi:hypothetical protein